MQDGYIWRRSHFRPRRRGNWLNDVTSAQNGDWSNLEFMAMVNEATDRKGDPHFRDRAYLCLVVAAKRSLEGDHQTAQIAASRASYRLALLQHRDQDIAHYIFARILELTISIRSYEALGREYNPPEVPYVFRRFNIQRVIIDQTHMQENLKLIARAIQSPLEPWCLYGMFQDHIFPSSEPRGAS
jgi:hypothetical protein